MSKVAKEARYVEAIQDGRLWAVRNDARVAGAAVMVQDGTARTGGGTVRKVVRVHEHTILVGKMVVHCFGAKLSSAGLFSAHLVGVVMLATGGGWWIVD